MGRPMTLRLSTIFFPVLPLLAYVLVEGLFFSLANTTLSGLEHTFEKSDVYAETALRYRFLTITLLYILIAALTLGHFLAEILRARRDLAPASLLGVLASFTLVFAVALALVMGPNEGKLYAALGLDVFQSALNGCTTFAPAACVFGGSTAPGGIPVGFTITINLGAGATIAAVIAAALGSALALNQSEERLRTASRKELFKKPREFLYLSSVLFTVGMAALVTWTGWPLVVLDGPAADSYREVQRAANMYYGVAFSTIILSYYLPTVLLLNLQLDRYRGQRRTLEHNESEGALPGSPLRMVENVLAFVSPILTAMIAGAGAQIFNAIGAASG